MLEIYQTARRTHPAKRARLRRCVRFSLTTYPELWDEFRPDLFHVKPDGEPMPLHLCPLPAQPSAKIISLCSGPEVQISHVYAELENMAAALARYHGNQTARLMVADAFAQAFARWAVDSGRPSVCRFSLQVAIDNAFAERAGPPGGEAA
jgi:hypothetical protein